LTHWVKRADLNWTLCWFQQGSTAKQDDLEKIKTKLIELYWFEDVLCRLDQLEASLEGVTHKLAKRMNNGGTMVTQNVLVDGSNLAFRCFYAPGMAALTDKAGRPTGVILGFLRSLGALRKRFPEARLYVVWDGSSERRKAVYADYKANRPAHSEPIFDQMAYIRATLPGLGVWQVFNPREEADDVIATLVRGGLKDQHNVVYSTDKDMLSLITDTTLVLMPGVGSRKEILYDTKTLESVFGVPPDQILQLRALCGDSSDNLPGVPRVPKKILRSLVQAHHSVKGIYESSLTGVSEGQYERLRLSEPQVKLNLQLMAFADVPVTSVDPNPDVEGVAKRLQDVGINPASILKHFEGG
jgi:5'-3' exonuclease